MALKNERKREEQIIANKEKSQNIIIDENIQGFVYDIYDIIETSQESPAIRVRNLIQAGIPIELVAEAYARVSPNVNNIDEALNGLDTAFLILAQSISDYPNGIVIDIETGRIDEKKSRVQALDVGITDINPTMIYADKILEEMGDIKKGNTINELTEHLNAIFGREVIKNEFIILNDTKWFWDVGNLGDLLKDAPKEYMEYVDSKIKLLQGYKPEQAEYIRLVHEMEHAKGTVMFDELQKKEAKMLVENPELIDFKVRDEDGKLDPKVDEFMDAERDAFIGIVLNRFKTKGYNEMTDTKSRKFMTIFALAAMKNPVFKDEALQVLGLEGKTLEEQLEFYNKVLKTRMTSIEDLNEKIDLFSESIEHAADVSKMFEGIQEGKIEDYLIDEMMKSMGKDMTVKSIKEQLKENKKTTIEKHFDNSDIDFFENDLKEINSSYREATINSWVSTKQDAKEYKFLMLYLEKESWESIENNNYINNSKVKATSKKIDAMLKQYPELESLLDENGELTDDARVKAESFKAEKLKAEVLKDYVKALNREDEFTRDEFEKMHISQQRDYLRTTFVGLEYAEANGNEALKKLALRRLEILNNGLDKEKHVVEVDKDGNYMLYEKNLLDLFYRKTDMPGVSTIEDMKKRMTAQFIKQNIVNKLGEIEILPEEAFFDVSDMLPEEQLTAIENFKSESRRQRVADGLEKENQQFEEVDDNEVPKIGIMDQIKKMFSRFKNRNQRLLTDGKESEEKKGLFSKLFGKKEKVTKVYIDVNEVINGKEEKQIKSTFDSYIYENKDGSIEKKAMDNMRNQSSDEKGESIQEQEINQ